MKLKKYNSEELIKYFNGEDVEIGEFKYNENDLRGIWISNVCNIDTPKLENIDQYKEYLIKMVQTVKSYNMNTIIFQVRPSNDAFYPSKLNPWSEYITGTQGKDPGFDIFEFVIEECKKVGIKVHAWINPYRVSLRSIDDLKMTKEEYLNTLAENNFARLYKEETVLDGKNKVILKPSSEKVVDFVTETVLEIATNYDIEAVHIDDYFYPYDKINPEYEEEDYKRHLATVNKTDTLDDFRRYNVDVMIKSIHDSLTVLEETTGKKVEFGISPFGVYRTNIELDPNGCENGSYHATGVCECYSSLYSDVYKWMKEGWIDYVVPQDYFPFERTDVAYHYLVPWWNNIAKETNVKLYIGMAIYRMGCDQNWMNPDEIANQLKFNSAYDGVTGTIFFTYHDLIKGDNEVKDSALESMKKLFKA